MAAATTDNKPKELVIFLYNGNTLLFENANIIAADERAIRFNYISKTTGKEKAARFFVKRIAGYSFGDLGEREEAKNGRVSL